MVAIIFFEETTSIGILEIPCKSFCSLHATIEKFFSTQSLGNCVKSQAVKQPLSCNRFFKRLPIPHTFPILVHFKALILFSSESIMQIPLDCFKLERAILLATLDSAFVGAIPTQVGMPVHFKTLLLIFVPYS